LDCCHPHFALSKRQHYNGFISLACLHPSPSLPIVMPIGLLIQMIADLPQDLMCFLVQILSHGGLKEQVVMARSSTGPNMTVLLWPQQKLFGCNHYCLSLLFLITYQLSIVTISAWLRWSYHNWILHARTKHLELELVFVRENVLKQNPHVVHVPAVDILTKSLCPSPSRLFTFCLINPFITQSEFEGVLV